MMKKKFYLPRKNAAKGAFGLLLVVGVLLWGLPTSVFAAEVSTTDNETADSEYPVYTEDTRPDFPVFNALEGKQNFLSIEAEDGKVFTGGIDTLELAAGQTYHVRIAYCNDGLPKGVPNSVYAHGSKVKAHLPDLVDGEQTITATLSAVDTKPSSISTSLVVTSDVPLQLEFVSGTARIHNANKTNNSPVSASDLFGTGADFGTNSMTGIILYGEEYSGTIEFDFTTSLVDQESLWTEDEQPEAPTIVDLAPDTTHQQSESEVPFYLYLLLLVAVILLVVAIGYGVYYTLGRRNRHYRR